MPVVWFLFVLLTATATAKLKCNLSKRGEITKFLIDGKIYNSDLYPYVVALAKIIRNGPTASTCTGSLISPLFVLTAAYCTDQMAASRILVYRHNLLSTNRNFREVDQIFQHENYNKITHSADISLLKLKKCFDGISKFASISGQPTDFNKNTTLNCEIIGFGHKNVEGAVGIAGYIINTTINYGKSSCDPNNFGNDVEVENTWEEFLCGTTNSICCGDNGGPVVCKGSLYGIVSHGNNFPHGKITASCSNVNGQSRHVFIHAYSQWISATMLKSVAITRMPSILWFCATVFAVVTLNAPKPSLT